MNRTLDWYHPTVEAAYVWLRENNRKHGLHVLFTEEFKCELHTRSDSPYTYYFEFNTEQDKTSFLLRFSGS